MNTITKYELEFFDKIKEKVFVKCLEGQEAKDEFKKKYVNSEEFAIALKKFIKNFRDSKECNEGKKKYMKRFEQSDEYKENFTIFEQYWTDMKKNDTTRFKECIIEFRRSYS